MLVAETKVMLTWDMGASSRVTSNVLDVLSRMEDGLDVFLRRRRGPDASAGERVKSRERIVARAHGARTACASLIWAVREKAGGWGEGRGYGAVRPQLENEHQDKKGELDV
jgi:hypothetical protein